MRIFGTERALPKGASLPRPARVEIKFGEPFLYPLPENFEDLRGDALKAVYFDIGREIMKRIAALEAEKRVGLTGIQVRGFATQPRYVFG